MTKTHPAVEAAEALNWADAPTRIVFGAGVKEALVELDKDHTLRLYAEAEALQLVLPALRATLPGLREVGEPVAKLAAFGAWAAREFRDSLADVDGGSAQDAMERFGVIVKRVVTEPCGEACVCAEYGPFPHDCYTFPADVAAVLYAAPPSPAPQPADHFPDATKMVAQPAQDGGEVVGRAMFDRWGVLVGEVRDYLNTEAQDYHERGLDSTAQGLGGLAHGLGDMLASWLGHATPPTTKPAATAKRASCGRAQLESGSWVCDCKSGECPGFAVEPAAAEAGVVEALQQARSALQKTMGVWGGTCAWHADVKAALATIDAALAAQPAGQGGA